MADSAAMFGPPLFWARVSPGLPSVAAACSRVPKSGQGLPFTPRAALRRASLWPEASPWPEHFRFNGIVGLRARTGPTRDGVPGPRYLGGCLVRMAVGWFYLSVLALCSLGSICILSTIYWMRYWHGGFAWDGSILMFNWHPVLMVTSMVVLYSAASLVYRLPQSWVGPRLPWKSGHAAMHLLAFLLTVLGLHAVFEFHNHAKIPHLYSLHSWLGITTIFLFACQWFLGFSVFLLPWASMWLRSLLKPIHVFFGASILSLAIASVVSGINEKLFFSLKNGTKSYSNLPSEAVFANCAGMLVVVFGLLVLYILLASSWKRPEPGMQAEREALLRGGE
ncbi:hypothetical protein MJG53_016805 [Ovis ammon polii x Ovis aries]|uniref:Lysosomal membrane ascorbate-dependent ferrireductase CYB561A3 n=3 Tax=Ovis TaxID=9935 RepID=A0A835ZM09_SHEEP|nr:hypothetical protein JEQ12_011111 [Ovis aries]KAI4561751.1 hypothetical protein MJG53_016805 [Ovis ammon polii x Ovis aries]